MRPLDDIGLDLRKIAQDSENAALRGVDIFAVARSQVENEPASAGGTHNSGEWRTANGEERSYIVISMTQYFSASDYLLALPMVP